VQEFLTIFLALLVETTPFLLAGVVLAVVGGPWLHRAVSSFGSNSPLVGIAAGTSAGLALPMCDCGSRPLSHRMAQVGQTYFAVAFLVAAPIINPIVIVTTWLAFRDVDLVIARMGLAIAVAVVAALVLGRMSGNIARQLAPEAPVPTGPPAPWHERIPNEILHDFVGLFIWLVLGSAAAAALQVYVDTSVFTGQSGLILPILMMMALGFVLSICSSVDALVIAGLGSGLGTGPLLGFLVVGPILNLKSMPLYGRLFSVTAVGVLSIVTLEVAFAGALLAELRGW
jgi:uncharacterized membrane protein YraQ (UPF0718 family)